VPDSRAARFSTDFVCDMRATRTAALRLIPPRMPIRRLLVTGSFSQDDAATLVAAYKGTLRALHLVDRDDPAVMLVAERIVALSKEGELDSTALRDRVVRSFTN
jgi:hypothetical protein